MKPSTNVTQIAAMMRSGGPWPRTSCSAKIVVIGQTMSQKTSAPHAIPAVLRGHAAGRPGLRFRTARLPLMRGRAAGGARTGMRNGGVDGSRGGSTG